MCLQMENTETKCPETSRWRQRLPEPANHSLCIQRECIEGSVGASFEMITLWTAGTVRRIRRRKLVFQWQLLPQPRCLLPFSCCLFQQYLSPMGALGTDSQISAVPLHVGDTSKQKVRCNDETSLKWGGNLSDFWSSAWFASSFCSSDETFSGPVVSSCSRAQPKHLQHHRYTFGSHPILPQIFPLLIMI